MSKTEKHTCECTICSIWTREMLIVSSTFWTEIPWGAKVTKRLTNGVCHVGSQGAVVTRRAWGHGCRQSHRITSIPSGAGVTMSLLILPCVLQECSSRTRSRIAAALRTVVSSRTENLINCTSSITVVPLTAQIALGGLLG